MRISYLRHISLDISFDKICIISFQTEAFDLSKYSLESEHPNIYFGYKTTILLICRKVGNLVSSVVKW
jgi:hypothetical protein